MSGGQKWIDIPAVRARAKRTDGINWLLQEDVVKWLRQCSRAAEAHAEISVYAGGLADELEASTKVMSPHIGTDS